MIVQVRTNTGGIFKTELTNYVLWHTGVEFRHAYEAKYCMVYVDGTDDSDYKFYNYNWVIINDVEYRINEDDTPESYLNRILIIAHNIEIEETISVLE